MSQLLRVYERFGGSQDNGAAVFGVLDFCIQQINVEAEISLISDETFNASSRSCFCEEANRD